MHRVLHPRSYSWLALAFLALASGCPASPPDVSLRPDGGEPDARVVDAAGPDMDAPGPQGDGGGPGPDARPGGDGGGPGGTLVEYGWPPSNEFSMASDYEPNRIILQRLTIGTAGTIAHMGIIVRGLSGTAAKIGLYREVAGLPTDLVATTEVFITSAGINQVPPVDPVAVEPGNYWSAVVFDDITGLATSPTGVSTLRIADVPFLSSLPTSLSSSTQTNGFDMNVYVGILEP